jgi:hypothetical protein
MDLSRKDLIDLVAKVDFSKEKIDGMTMQEWYDLPKFVFDLKVHMLEEDEFIRFQLLMESFQFQMQHEHECPRDSCKTVWSHKAIDSKDEGDHFQSHRCPNCGTAQWKKRKRLTNSN